MADSSGRVLVTGATGSQGGAAARALLAMGTRVRFLTRDPKSDAAQALVASGAQAAQGDLGDPASIAAAMHGVDAVFSVQVPDRHGGDDERRHGLAIVEGGGGGEDERVLCLAIWDAPPPAGVTRFVHTSVAQAGNHTRFPGWNEGRWLSKYWTDKWDIEEAVRRAGFAQWTVLQPAFMMDNLARPKSRYLFPHLAQGKLLSALLPETKLHFIAADDVGAFAAAALAGPSPLHGRTIPLASQALTMSEVATTLSKTLSAPVTAMHVSPQEARDSGLFAGWVTTQEWMNEVGYAVDLDKTRSWGIALTSLDAWLAVHGSAVDLPLPA
jgi:uncharacterized protein YbjT (DUF2867 family)